MAENDEYYGSQKARDAYDSLRDAYQSEGWSDEQIDEVLQMEIPDNEYFNSRGIYNYHGERMFYLKMKRSWSGS